jgi:hypothetical protein
MLVVMDQKRCKKCGDEKSLDAFYMHPRMTDGRLNTCKRCCSDAAEARRKANPEIQLSRQRAWREAHPEAWEERKRKNRERMSTPAAKERSKDVRAAWRANNPERIKAIARRNYLKSIGSPATRKSASGRQARAKAVEASAEKRRGVGLTGEQRQKISEGLKRSYAEGTRRAGHSEETKQKISETKRAAAELKKTKPGNGPPEK